MSVLDVLVYAVTFALAYALLTVGADWIGPTGSMVVLASAYAVAGGYMCREFYP